MFYLLLMCFWLAANALLWRAADRRARGLRGGWIFRVFFAVFYGAMIFYLCAIPLWRIITGGPEVDYMPPLLDSAAYIWHPIILSLLVLPVIGVYWAGRVARRMLRGKRQPVSDPQVGIEASGNESHAADPAQATPTFSRRQAFKLVASTIPPVVTCGLTGVAMAQRGDFRVRPLTIAVPDLPPDLDGLTIAHVTDLHAGHFLPSEAIARAADATNALQADLVVFTGDLIDRGLIDRLPLGLELLRRLDPRNGLAIIEGNHDILESTDEFEAQIRQFEAEMREPKQGKLSFLLDEQVVYHVPSKRTPGKQVAVQFMGISWGEYTWDMILGRRKSLRLNSDETTGQLVRKVAALRRPDAFPILLAHHPHAFDAAAECKLPLTLSGHTHGGQIMLTQNIGAGPLRFRYWNGVHERNGCQLVISNGIGAWFPLRMNAPAEILHITLMAGA